MLTLGLLTHVGKNSSFGLGRYRLKGKERWLWVDAMLAPVMQLVKATPVASFIILALVWVSGKSLSILISFFMVLPVLYGAARTGWKVPTRSCWKWPGCSACRWGGG